MKKVLGIDPGTVVTGYGVIDSELNPLDFGAIRPPPKLPLNERYLIIFEGIEMLIEKFSPDVVAVESQFVHKNPQTALKLGMARGVVIIAATRRGIPVHEYTPKKAKQAVTGTGNAGKAQVQRMIQMLLSLDEPPEPEDAADALALAICHINQSRIPCTNT